MSIEIWLSFVAASLLLCFSPGPTVFLVMGQSLNHGKKSVLPLIAGALTGDTIAMTLSFAGLGALLATSATLFNAFKWLGAAYLIFLGIKTFMTPTTAIDEQQEPMRHTVVFRNALLVTALNPKSIMFFMAFFPLFVDLSKPALPQMLIMAASFLFASTVSVASYAAFSGHLRSRVRSPRFQNVFNKVSGSVLIGAGALTATIHNKV